MLVVLQPGRIGRLPKGYHRDIPSGYFVRNDFGDIDINTAIATIDRKIEQIRFNGRVIRSITYVYFEYFDDAVLWKYSI